MAHPLSGHPTLSARSGARQRAPTPGLPALVGGLLVLLVALTHAWLVHVVGQGLAQMAADAAVPPRVQVRYVREMVVAPPLPVAEPPRPLVAAKPAPPAGAPLPRRLSDVVAQQGQQDSTVAPEAQTPPAAAEPSASAPANTPAAPTQPPAAVAAASSAVDSPTAQASAPEVNLTEQALDTVWPQTTRVTYAAQGYYNGEFYGDATVEWVRQGDRYQMFMDVSLGLGIYQRIATSRGRVSQQGAQPERFDETIKRLFSKPRQFKVSFGEDQIEFSQGNKVARPAGVQDTTSQFVQLTYLFATQPELAEPGQRIEFPLAFHRNLRAYAYQVQGRQVLQTALGPLDTVHVIPRRVEPKDNDLVAQIWFAPALKYLPARIRFNQGEDIYIELNIRKAPELAQ
jgi:hypothetical protein